MYTNSELSIGYRMCGIEALGPAVHTHRMYRKLDPEFSGVLPVHQKYLSDNWNEIHYLAGTKYIK